MYRMNIEEEVSEILIVWWKSGIICESSKCKGLEVGLGLICESGEKKREKEESGRVCCYWSIIEVDYIGILCENFSFYFE